MWPGGRWAWHLTCVQVAAAVTLFSRFVPAVVKQCSVKAWISLKPIPNSAKKTGIHPAHPSLPFQPQVCCLPPELGRQRWAWWWGWAADASCPFSVGMEPLAGQGKGLAS